MSTAAATERQSDYAASLLDQLFAKSEPWSNVEAWRADRADVIAAAGDLAADLAANRAELKPLVSLWSRKFASLEVIQPAIAAFAATGVMDAGIAASWADFCRLIRATSARSLTKDEASYVIDLLKWEVR